ncbi:MAG: FixH family protein [Hyphomicrobium sp.]
MNASPQRADGGRQLTGRHVLIAMLSFFALILATNAYMIERALTTFGGVETADAYRIGLKYNARIENAALQSQLGWSDAVGYARDTETITVDLKDASGAPVTGLTAQVTLARPATNRFDRRLELAADANGRYVAPAGVLEAGSWIVLVEARRDGASQPIYVTRSRIWVTP